MEAGIYHFVIEQGATFLRNIVWETDDVGGVQNLTGYTAKLEIRSRRASTAPLVFRFSTSPAAGEGTITLGGANGTILVTATAALTGALVVTAPDALFYDLELSAAPTVTRLLEGRVTVSAGVTA